MDDHFFIGQMSVVTVIPHTQADFDLFLLGRASIHGNLLSLFVSVCSLKLFISAHDCPDSFLTH